ncbi:hypothetical protein BDV10DRAFT_164737 [Aspergillus recurvatus]
MGISWRSYWIHNGPIRDAMEETRAIDRYLGACTSLLLCVSGLHAVADAHQFTVDSIGKAFQRLAAPADLAQESTAMIDTTR